MLIQLLWPADPTKGAKVPPVLAASPVATTEITLPQFLSMMRHRWPWVALPVVFFVSAAAAWTLTRPAIYESSARVFLADTASQATLDPSSQDAGSRSRELSNEINLAHSDLVKDLVEAEVGVVPNVSISAASDADVLVFTATASTPDDAASFANTWAEQYIWVKRDEAVADIARATARLREQLEDLRLERQRLRAPLDDLDDEILAADDEIEAAILQRRYERLADDLRYELELTTSQAEATMASLTDLELQSEFAAVGEARVVQVAAPPQTPIRPPLVRNLVLGVALGLLSGVGLALLADNRDNTLKNAADVSAITDVPVLASIPEADRRKLEGVATATHLDPEGAFANGYHKVRSSLEFASLDIDLRTVLVTSPGASEGKSTTSSNLALAFASVGKRTVLVDVDFRRARVHEIFGLPRAPGLTDVTLYGAGLATVAYGGAEPGLEGLRVVPSGTAPPNPAAFVGTNGFADTVESIRQWADVVVLDSPPMLAVSDPHTMASQVDAVVLTVRAAKTTKGQLLEAIAALGQVGANLVGLILIGVDESEAYGGYSYYRSDRQRSSAGSRRVGSKPFNRRSDTRSIDIDLPALGSTPHRVLHD